MSYAFGLAEAERRHDEKALKKLRAIGPPPYPAKSVFVERTVVNRLDGQMRLGILWKAGRALFGRPESSIFDLPNLVRGFGFTLDAMWAEVSKLNLLKLVPALKMPVVIFVGRRDHWVPPETSVAYFDALDCAVEETGVVRSIRARSIRRRAREVQRDHGGVGAAARFIARRRERIGAAPG